LISKIIKPQIKVHNKTCTFATMYSQQWFTWWKKWILWKLCCIQIKLLNDIACSLIWIETQFNSIQFKFNWIELKFLNWIQILRFNSNTLKSILLKI
jgi:hypothetical protein